MPWVLLMYTLEILEFPSPRHKKNPDDSGCWGLYQTNMISYIRRRLLVGQGVCAARQCFTHVVIEMKCAALVPNDTFYVNFLSLSDVALCFLWMQAANCAWRQHKQTNTEDISEQDKRRDTSVAWTWLGDKTFDSDYRKREISLLMFRSTREQ